MHKVSSLRCIYWLNSKRGLNLQAQSCSSVANLRASIVGKKQTFFFATERVGEVVLD